MAHPHNALRQNRVEHSRVKHIVKGYAHGGAVESHEDEVEDRKMVKRMVKKTALRAEGGRVKARQDKPHRAKGGRVGKHKTNINIMVGHPGGPQGGLPVPVPVPAPPSATAMPVPAPMPRPVAPPAAGIAASLPPPGGAPVLPPGIRKAGGRTYKRGGAVKDGPGWTESEKTKTPVQHTDGKDDGKDLGRGRPITYARGGAIEHPPHGAMAPNLHAGAGGGLGRLRKAAREKRRG